MLYYNNNFTFIKNFSSLIIPKLSKKIINLNKLIIGIINIETFNYNNILIPYAIGIYIIDNKNYNIKNPYINILYLNNFYKKKNNIKDSLKNASFNMIKNMILNLKQHMTKSNIIYLYSHNLGNFDGYLIFNAIYNIYGSNIKILMDNENKFIEIKFDNIILRDSYRILPLSLFDLCKLIPNCKKKIKFNYNKINYNLIIKDSTFIKNYLINNLIINYEIIIYFIKFLNDNYYIKFTNLYSVSNLAFNIYRTNYYKENIPIINTHIYNLIKKSYYGGSYFIKSELKYYSNLYYYDVNSLYPYCMLNDMPGKYIKYYNNLNNEQFIKEDMFGFYYCIIDIPKDKKNYIIISRNKINNKLYYPKDKIEGLYFSEEIKNWIKYGYNIKVLKGFQFERLKDIFKDHILNIYQSKVKSKNLIEKFIYKLLLNGLYGYLARNPYKDNIKIVNNNTFLNLSRFYNYKNIIHFNKDEVLIKYINNLKNNINKEDLIDYYDNYIEYNNKFKTVYSNIAIASAITSYGRIFISNFYNENLIYSDTDSIITNKPLNEKYIGKDIGKFKLEAIIKEFYLYKHKIYAYKDINNNITIKSAGIINNILTLNDFKKRILNNKLINIKFNKIISNIKDMSLSIKKFNIKL